MLLNDIYLEIGQYRNETSRIFELAQRAVELKNIEGLTLIASSYPIMIARLLNKIEEDTFFFDFSIGEDLVQLYSLTKRHLKFRLRKQLLDALIPYITRKASKIYRLGISSQLSRYKPYQLGDNWDLEMTIERLLSSGARYPDYNSIVVHEISKKKRSIVLCIDKSLSVFSFIHQIVLTAAVLAFSITNENYCVIAFDSKAQIIKSIDEYVDHNKIIERILDLESEGKTNLEAALSKAYEQLNKTNAREKEIILISDLERTVGKDPLPIIKQLPRLKVVYTRTARSNKLIQELTRFKNVKIEELREDTDLVALSIRLLS